MVPFEDQIGVGFAGFGDAGVGEVDAFDPVFGLFDGLAALDVAFHQVGHDFWGRGVEVDAEVEDIGDSVERTAVDEEVVAFDEADVDGLMDVDFVGDDVVGEAGIAGPEHVMGTGDERSEMFAEGFGVDGVGLAFDGGEGDFGAVGEFAEVGVEVAVGEVEAIHREGGGMGFFVEEAAFDEETELLGQDRFAGTGRSADADEEAPGPRLEPQIQEPRQERTPKIDPFGGMDIRADELRVDFQVERLVEEPRIGIDEINGQDGT